jgi:signal transduction histidine kinase
LAADAPLVVDEAFVAFAERLLSGAIGGVAARLVLEGVLGERAPAWDEVMALVDEARAVREANERLRELDRMKDEFIASVSHELRTPLAAVRAYAELWAADPDIDRETRRKFYQTMVRESERLTRLVNQVLDLAKLDSGHAEWRHEAVDLRTVVHEVAETMRPVMRERGGELGVVVPQEEAICFGDRDRLVQLLLNLVGNAVQFMNGAPRESGGAVTTRRTNLAAYRRGQWAGCATRRTAGNLRTLSPRVEDPGTQHGNRAGVGDRQTDCRAHGGGDRSRRESVGRGSVRGDSATGNGFTRKSGEGR